MNVTILPHCINKYYIQDSIKKETTLLFVDLYIIIIFKKIPYKVYPNSLIQLRPSLVPPCGKYSNPIQPW